MMEQHLLTLSISISLFRCLVSKLFDVCPRSTMEEMESQNEVRVAWGTGIAGHVAESGEPVNIPDAYEVSELFLFILIEFSWLNYEKLIQLNEFSLMNNFD